MFLSSLLGAVTWYPIFESKSVMDITRSVFFWLTIAIVLAFVVCALVLRDEKRKRFFKVALPCAIGYACVVGIVLLILSFCEDGIELLLFVPLLILLLSLGGSGLLLCFKRNKLVYLFAACVVGAAAIATLVCMGVLFASGKSLWNNWIVNENEDDIDPSKVNQIGLYVSAAIAILVLVATALFLGRKDKKPFDSKTIAYAAICIAMSYALSYLRIVKMPQGGSITIASLLPLMIFSYMYGVKKGVFVGMIYGILQAFQDFYVLHPAQFILDYPAAFACIGLAGAFANVKKLEKLPQLQFALGAIVAGLSRFVMHFLSGIFAFGAFATAGQPVWLYSLTYQSAYVLPDIAIAIAVGVLVFCSPSFVKTVRRVAAAKSASEE